MIVILHFVFIMSSSVCTFKYLYHDCTEFTFHDNCIRCRYHHYHSDIRITQRTFCGEACELRVISGHTPEYITLKLDELNLVIERKQAERRELTAEEERRRVE